MPLDAMFRSHKPHFLLSADAVTQRDIVMSSKFVPSRTLIQIEEELDCDEREGILFACRGITSNTNIRELLSELNDKTTHGLAEILYVVKRFDLLKKYLMTSKADVEKLMTQSRVISCYRNLMIDLNEQIEEEDLESLVFLLKNELRNTGKLKKKTFLSLVTDLEKNRSITPENLDLLEKSFQNIHRVDLKNKILKFKQKGHAVHGGTYINAFAVSPTNHWPNNQTSSSTRPRFEMNGHKVGAPIQETGSAVQTEISNERYLVRRETLGFCLIIDCVGNDAEMLEHTFTALHFFVKCHMYKTINDVEEILKDVASMEQHRYHDIFICILISRGSSEFLFCVDGNLPGLSLNKIKKFFTGQSCPSLIGKPKLFFIQNYISCDIVETQDGSLVEMDGTSQNAASRECIQSCSKIPDEADIFWSHCKGDIRELQRFSDTTSLYLRSLTAILDDKQKRKHQDLQDIHTELNRIIYSKQTGYSLQLRHTLTKKLFLHPA